MTTSPPPSPPSTPRQTPPSTRHASHSSSPTPAAGQSGTATFGTNGDATKSREHEPLLESPSQRSSVSDRTTEIQHVHSQEETKSLLYIILLTISIGGLQMAWATELSSISPFLLSLGISKAVMALVWIAGPLSGTLVQPYVGIRSDDCRLRWGRRRPFMVGGAIATGTSLLLLSWTREIIGGILGIFGAAPDSKAVSIMSQIYAVVLVYVLDFAINVIQAAIRAFIVDCAPTHQQDSANAWANRITGVGSILGYLFGYVELAAYLPFLGHTQFQVLCSITCFALAITLALSCSTISERDPRQYGAPSRQASSGIVAFFKNLFLSIRRLPPQIQRVCLVQIFAWIGWFPILFYTSTYIGGIYAEPFFAADPNLPQAEVEAIWERGTREGSWALFIFAITTFASSVILPIVITPSYAPVDTKPAATTPLTQHPPTSAQSQSTSYFPLKPSPSSALSSPRASFAAFLGRLRIPGLTLRRAWLLSHLFFCLLSWCTLFVRSTTAAVVLVALIGIPWSLTNWAPFALIASEISKRDAIRRGLRAPPPTRDGELLARGEHGGAADQAGVVLGIHNVAIAAPQVVATVVSSVIFRALQKERGLPGDRSVEWVIRFGGVCALGAAWACRYVREGEQDEQQQQHQQQQDERE